MLTIDIAHPPLSGAVAEETLDAALRKVRLSDSLRVIRIIHGYGSAGKGGTLRVIARNWAFRQRHVRGVIYGEDLSLFNSLAQSMCSECGISIGSMGSSNEGMSLIWVK